MTFFFLKSGQDLENLPAHPYQEFPGYPPPGGQEQGVNHVIIMDDSFRLLFTYS